MKTAIMLDITAKLRLLKTSLIKLALSIFSKFEKAQRLNLDIGVINANKRGIEQVKIANLDLKPLIG